MLRAVGLNAKGTDGEALVSRENLKEDKRCLDNDPVASLSSSTYLLPKHAPLPKGHLDSLDPKSSLT